jgi:protein-tyrosine-phosphatase
MKTVLVAFLIMATSTAFAQKDKKIVLIVCEHGTAKSIVAAEYVRKFLSGEGLDLLVVSRGTNPDDEVPEKINKLLEGDGFKKHSEKPQKLSQADLNAASYVIMFSQLPSNLTAAMQLENWNVPSFEAGYPIARDSIIDNAKRLVRKIKSDTKN